MQFPSASSFAFQRDTLLRPEPTAASGAARRLNRLNRWMAVYVGVFTVGAAVPLGLNRPLFWLTWGLVTAAVALIYLIAAHACYPTRKMGAQHHWGLFALALIVPGFAAIQALPLGLGGAWPPDAVPAPSAGAPLPAAPHLSLLPGASLMAALRYLLYVLFAMLVIETSGRGERAMLVGWIVFWGVVAHAAWALAALRLWNDTLPFGIEKTAYVGSATGTFINRNAFASFLAMGGSFGLALAIDRLYKGSGIRMSRGGASILTALRTLSIWMGLAVIAIALAASQSRMGFVAGGAGAMVALVAVQLKNGVSPAQVLMRALGLAGGMVVVLVSPMGVMILDRALSLGSELDMRVNGYTLAWELIEARPWTGYGMDAFRPAFELVHRPPMPGDQIWDRAHSIYLANWVELGLIVGSVPAILGAAILVRLIGAIRHDDDTYALGAGALAALAAAALHGVVDFGLEMPANMILLTAFAGLGLAHRRRRTRH